MLLSETWLSSKTSLNLDINGYFSKHIFGNKAPGTGTVKGRYSGGISLYAKNYLKNKIKIVEQNQNGVLWIKLSSALFTFKEDVFICSVYIPPADSRIYHLADCNFWEEIEKGIELYSLTGKVFITGDFNGRTSNFLDILDFDRYFENQDLLYPRFEKVGGYTGLHLSVVPSVLP